MPQSALKRSPMSPGRAAGATRSNGAGRAAQASGDMAAAVSAWDEARGADERGEDVVELGKGLARVAGARLAAKMLAESSLSLRQIQERFGFQPAALSNMANGKTLTGPTLWKLFALAEALGYDLKLDAVKR